MWKPDDAQKSRMKKAYDNSPLTVDRLPFTKEFDAMYDELDFDRVTKNELFMALANMRKRKELPKKPR